MMSRYTLIRPLVLVDLLAIVAGKRSGAEPQTAARAPKRYGDGQQLAGAPRFQIISRTSPVGSLGVAFRRRNERADRRMPSLLTEPFASGTGERSEMLLALGGGA